jgi:hypothetical protein
MTAILCADAFRHGDLRPAEWGRLAIDLRMNPLASGLSQSFGQWIE